MRLTRRLVLTGSAALTAGAMLPLTARRIWAVTTVMAGDFQVDSLSDGYLEFPADFAHATLPQDERAQLIARFNLPTDRVQSPLNVTLLRQGGRSVLFDVGSGTDFMPNAGKLPEALSAIGVSPDDITDVIFTHGHPDHLWGLLDEFDEPAFANARLAMSRTEFDYWTDPATAETIGEERLSFAAGAMRRLTAVADRIERFTDGDEVVPGVRAVATPGHTPGHMSFAAGGPDAGLFVIGDAVTTVLGIARPDIPAATDHDPALASKTRAALLARLADEGWPVIGYHLPEGGIGRIARADGSFAFAPGT